MISSPRFSVQRFAFHALGCGRCSWLLALGRRLAYWRRVLGAYRPGAVSHLTFWHENPEVNPHFEPHELGEYYMTFRTKADYPGVFDASGIPLLDYHGRIGRQYNPIAIAQYGLGNYNLYRSTGDRLRRERFLRASDWLVDHLESNAWGVRVWQHHFDWEYRTRLRSPWYSALAQGQGISLLARAYLETRQAVYLGTASAALGSFERDLAHGGVHYRDEQGYLWFEEAVVMPPTHILNGFIWATWGVYDFWLLTRSGSAARLFAEAVRTLRANLPRFDAGFWSRYELSGGRLAMLASPFYHKLHLVQLEVMFRLTQDPVFRVWEERWQAYQASRSCRVRALGHKILFKLLYY